MFRPILHNHKAKRTMKFAQHAVAQQRRVKSDLRVARVRNTCRKLHKAA